MPISTIGYEGTSIDRFIERLEVNRIQLIVDVRAVAVSRRKGFSKTKLSQSLSDRGIGYVHLRGLGDPKPGREAARRGDFAAFRSIFGVHLKTPEAQQGMALVGELASRGSLALMCYESDPTHCHRTIIAAAIAFRGGHAIQHLSVFDAEGFRHDNSRTRRNSGEGLAAA